MREKQITISKNTLKKYITSLNHIRDYEKYKRKRLTLEDMNKIFSYGFMTFLIQKKCQMNSSAGKLLKMIKTFLHDCLENKYTSNIDFA